MQILFLTELSLERHFNHNILYYILTESILPQGYVFIAMQQPTQFAVFSTWYFGAQVGREKQSGDIYSNEDA